MFDCDIKELISPEKYLVEQKNIANQLEYSKNDSRMHLFAFFGRLITLLSFLGVIGAYSDDVDFSLKLLPCAFTSIKRFSAALFSLLGI